MQKKSFNEGENPPSAPEAPATKRAERESFHPSAVSGEAFSLSQDREIYTTFVSEAMEHLEEIEINLINLEQSPEPGQWVNALSRSFHTLKGIAGFLDLKDIETLLHAMESLLGEARNHKINVDQEVIDLLLESIDLLKKMVLEVEKGIASGQVYSASYDLSPLLEKATTLQNKKSFDPVLSKPKGLSEEFDSIQPPLGEILSSKGIVSRTDIQKALQEQAAGRTGKKIGEILIKDQKAKPKQVIEALRYQKSLAGQLEEGAIKVENHKLDHLIDLVGELVMVLFRVQQNSLLASLKDQRFIRDFSRIRQITTDLQKISMSIRMTPIRVIFKRMIRLVRDLAKKSGKSIELIIAGEETEIDRIMAETLYDPLVHLIRNAIDHGIETPEKRKEIGKTETGRVYLRAFHDSGNVVVEVEDDGQGLNRQKIQEKAEERRLIPPGSSLNPHQIQNLVFEPGFSTSDQVTDISGRGVGLDVVKKAMEKLKGRVEIFSLEKKGCKVTLRIPLTLVMRDGLVVRIGQERYMVPTEFIRATLSPHPGDFIETPAAGKCLQFENRLLPLIYLDRFLGIIPRPKESKKPWVIVVAHEGFQKGLVVDEILGKHQIVIKNPEDKSPGVKGLAGATLMGDGGVSFILDIKEILEGHPYP